MDPWMTDDDNLPVEPLSRYRNRARSSQKRG